MSTNPPLNLEGHISNLLIQLSKFIPNLNEHILVFYDENKCVISEEGQIINKEDLLSPDKFVAIFEKLCSEGREWINISGDSWYQDKFLVSFDYSQKTGFPITSVLIGGPNFGGTAANSSRY